MEVMTAVRPMPFSRKKQLLPSSAAWSFLRTGLRDVFLRVSNGDVLQRFFVRGTVVDGNVFHAGQDLISMSAFSISAIRPLARSFR